MPIRSVFANSANICLYRCDPNAIAHLNSIDVVYTDCILTYKTLGSPHNAMHFTYVVYNPQALSSALTLLGHHSAGSSVSKFHRSLYFEV